MAAMAHATPKTPECIEAREGGLLVVHFTDGDEEVVNEKDALRYAFFYPPAILDVYEEAKGG